MKKLKIVLWALSVVFFFGIVQGIREGMPFSDLFKFLITLLILVAVLWFVHRKAKTKPKASAKSTPQSHSPVAATSATRRRGSANSLPQERYKTIKVVGVTFANDDGTNRQRLLKKLYFKDPPFDSYVDISFEEYDYQGETAFAVLANGYMIGNVGRNDIPFFEEFIYNHYVEDFEVSVGGMSEGKENIRYGCKIRISYRP